VSSLAMETQELLVRLDQHCGSFPEDLVAEVITRREEVTPRFLEILENIDRNPEPWLADSPGMIHIYAYICWRYSAKHVPIRC